MPELPEVEVVRRGLEKNLCGLRVCGCEVVDARELKGQDPHEFARLADGWLVSAAVRRGKFLWLENSERSDTALVLHLGMSGQALVNDESIALDTATSRHLRVRLHFTGGKRLDFVDQRLFGKIRFEPLAETADAQPGGLGSPTPRIPLSVRGKIARDVLDPAFQEQLAAGELARAFKRRRSPVKAVLLDQALASGVGNIYADEALFAARIHPLRPACKLTKKQVGELYASAAEVMRRALAEGGTSFDALYVDTEGNPGYFARQLAVYGRAGEPCLNCGETLVKTVVAGRGTAYCARCQK